MGEMHTATTPPVDGNAAYPSVGLMEKQASPPGRAAAQSFVGSEDEARSRQPKSTSSATDRTKRKDAGWLRHTTRWLFENQTSKLPLRALFSHGKTVARQGLTVYRLPPGISFHLVATIFVAHKFFHSRLTSKFVTLAYYNPSTGKYGAGADDYFFMTFCVVVFTGLRAGTMEYVLVPLARRWGISKKKGATRFAEQAWLWLYCCVIWPVGMVRPRPFLSTSLC